MSEGGSQCPQARRATYARQHGNLTGEFLLYLPRCRDPQKAHFQIVGQSRVSTVEGFQCPEVGGAARHEARHVEEHVKVEVEVVHDQIFT